MNGWNRNKHKSGFLISWSRKNGKRKQRFYEMKGGNTMQEKRTLYLAGKITGDPYYFTKFYNAQKKLEEGGFIVVNPALLPAEGFTWEAYMRMSGAMLAECAEVCFLPDWKESKGAKYEFGEAMAQNKPFFFFADWERTQEETGKYECTAEKTDKKGTGVKRKTL